MNLTLRVAALLSAFALAAPASAQTTLIPQGATWDYLDTGSPPSPSWVLPLFTPTGWSSGQAQLGYGNDGEVTTVSFGPDPEDKHTTTWFRHEFQVANPGTITNARLRILRDDGAIVYLNGAEVVRTNMEPGIGPPPASKFAQSAVGDAEEDFFFSFDVSPSLFIGGDNVVAVEVHQRSASSSDLAFDLDLVANVSPSVIRGPYLQMAGPNEMTVAWRTDVATDGRVWFGSSVGNLTQSVTDATHTQHHFVRLTGLVSETDYVYAVGTSTTVLAGDDTDHVFRTAPPVGEVRAARFWVLGDCGTADLAAEAVRDAYHAVTGATRTDAVLLLGDNAYNKGTDGEYEFSVFQMYTDTLRTTPFWSTRGNHETAEQDYLGIFDLPTSAESGGLASGTEKYYSFDFANIHFLCLDSYSSDRSVGGTMWTWADADLSATNQRWIVAFWHHPPYTKGSHDSDAEQLLIEMRQNFLPLLESHGVDVVLAGHSHSYERSYLIDGHYGTTATWDPATMLVDGGDGDEAGDGAYRKPLGANQGATYLTAGSSGKVTGNGPLDHPVMFYSQKSLGSVVLSFDGDRLDVEFVNALGQIEDQYTQFKDVALEADVASLSLSAGGDQTLSLKAGSGRGGDVYWVFGSGTGTSPGLDFGGGVLLPLNFDAYFNLTLTKPFAAVFGSFLATLDGEGLATAAFQLPPASDPSLAGAVLHHAYLTAPVIGQTEFASNAVSLTLVP